MTHATHSRPALLDRISRTRDTARLELHLFSMDAHQRWSELEAKLGRLEQRLGLVGEHVTEELSTAVRDLTRTVSDFLSSQRTCAELNLPAARLMHRDVRTCHPSDPLERAAQIMWEADCGVVPVESDEGEVVGIITDRDIAMACYIRGESLRTPTVGSVMSTELQTCSPEQTLQEALRLMTRAQVRRLLVTSSRGQLLGVLSLADVARCFEGDPRASMVLARTLASVSEPREQLAMAAQ